MGQVPTWLRVVSPITNLGELGGSGKKANKPASKDSSGRKDSEEMDSYKRGGKVKRTGPANLHKGELVVPRNKVKRVKKAMRSSKAKKGRGM